jgi:NAD+ diphosphatase
MSALDNHHTFLSQLESLSAYPGLFFTNDGLIVESQTERPLLPISSTLKALNIVIESIHLDHSIVIIQCHSDKLTKESSYAGYSIKPLRALLIQANPNSQLQIIRATHWLNWDRQSQYCGKCANPLITSIESTQKNCAHCGSIFFPRFSPAVMILIYRNKELLLARSPHFTPGVYSAVAGFVDVGETAEMAAHREIHEELRITVSDLEYFSSQTWPFPDSFMIAFRAKYLSGDLVVDPHELEDARWFSIDKLPTLPSSASIARKLIEWHIATTL